MIDLEKRIVAALRAYCKNKNCLHIPARDTDIDVVLSDCLKKITELKKDEIKYKEKHGKLLGKIHALEKKIARYESPDYVLVPRIPTKNMLDAGFVDGDYGCSTLQIYKEAMIEAVEKENA